MAIIHYDVTFQRDTPSLDKIGKQIEARSGLKLSFERDHLDADTTHTWPHIGKVRESASFECTQADGADFEITVGTKGVRVTCVFPGLNHYFRDQTLAALKDLGGDWKQALPKWTALKWSELSEREKHS